MRVFLADKLQTSNKNFPGFLNALRSIAHEVFIDDSFEELKAAYGNYEAFSQLDRTFDHIADYSLQQLIELKDVIKRCLNIQTKGKKNPKTTDLFFEQNNNNLIRLL